MGICQRGNPRKDKRRRESLPLPKLGFQGKMRLISWTACSSLLCQARAVYSLGTNRKQDFGAPQGRKPSVGGWCSYGRGMRMQVWLKDLKHEKSLSPRLCQRKKFMDYRRQTSGKRKESRENQGLRVYRIPAVCPYGKGHRKVNV